MHSNRFNARMHACLTCLNWSALSELWLNVRLRVRVVLSECCDTEPASIGRTYYVAPLRQ